MPILRQPPEKISELLAKKSHAQLIDVREPGEFSTEHAPGAINFPLSNFAALIHKIKFDAPVFILCQSGARAESAAAKLLHNNHGDIIIVAGGFAAWKKAELPVERGLRNVWSMERQVRFGAGSLTLIGIGLSFINPYFLGLSIFVGFGLVFSGITGWCGMALLLAYAPWNKKG